MIFMDLELARRLERASASLCKSGAESTAKLYPQLSVAVADIAGGIAVFAGIDSPVTQATGVGLDGGVTEQELDRLEEFFRSRGAATAVELCPLVEPSLYVAFARRDYRLAEVSNVLVREIAQFAPVPFLQGIEVRAAASDEGRLVTSTVGRGFASEVAVPEPLLAVGEGFFHAANNHSFLAFVGGEPAGGASAYIHESVVGMFGASTAPEFRRRGVHIALLAARMRLAAERGCELAMGITLPGSISQRNHERLGFQVAYTRTKLVRALAPSA